VKPAADTLLIVPAAPPAAGPDRALEPLPPDPRPPAAGLLLAGLLLAGVGLLLATAGGLLEVALTIP
jgi:hypothetical protein